MICSYVGEANSVRLGEYRKCYEFPNTKLFFCFVWLELIVPLEQNEGKLEIFGTVNDKQLLFSFKENVRNVIRFSGLITNINLESSHLTYIEMVL